jgi:hypothetical protein
MRLLPGEPETGIQQPMLGGWSNSIFSVKGERAILESDFSLLLLAERTQGFWGRLTCFKPAFVSS